MKIAQSVESYLHLVRLPATLAVLSSILAAHVIAAGGWPEWLVLIPQLAAGSVLFWSGVVLSDGFDANRGRTDAAAQSPAGAGPAWQTWLLGGGLMALGLVVAALAGTGSLRVAMALSVALVAYYGFLKDSPLGPVIMGACHYVAWMLGLAVAPLAEGAQAFALPVFFYAVAIALLAARQTRGADAGTIKFSIAALVLAVLMVIGLVTSGRLDQPLVLVPLALGVALPGYWLWRLVQRRQPRGGADAGGPADPRDDRPERPAAARHRALAGGTDPVAAPDPVSPAGRAIAPEGPQGPAALGADLGYWPCAKVVRRRCQRM